MKNITSFKTLFLAAAAVLFSFSDCRKGNFDEPPTGGETVTLTPTITIAKLRALHSTGGLETIQTDEILEATVIADDKSGNFYKQIFIQDATGGMEISVNATNQYTAYPVGRKIYVKCKGLVLGDGDNVVTMGGYVYDNVLQGISQTLLPAVILKGSGGAAIVPAERAISQLAPNDYGTLITIKNVEFAAADTTKTYADAVGKATANRTLFDCSGGKLTLRTSGYATFAGQKMARGKGTVTGVLTRYGTTDQLFIRDLADVKMDSARCGSGGTGNPGTGNLVKMDIADLRDFFPGTLTQAPVDKKIRGIVISDKAAGNITSKNLIIQDGTAGIAIRFTGTNTFSLGDEIEINISGLELSEYNKLLQMNNVPNGNAVLISTGKTVAPRVATVAEINTNQDAWESTLVQVASATITGAGGTLSGSTTVTDASGTITLYTVAASSLAATPLPSGQKKVTAIVGVFGTTKQLNLRNSADIQ